MEQIKFVISCEGCSLHEKECGQVFLDISRFLSTFNAIISVLKANYEYDDWIIYQRRLGSIWLIRETPNFLKEFEKILPGKSLDIWMDLQDFEIDGLTRGTWYLHFFSDLPQFPPGMSISIEKGIGVYLTIPKEVRLLAESILEKAIEWHSRKNKSKNCKIKSKILNDTQKLKKTINEFLDFPKLLDGIQRVFLGTIKFYEFLKRIIKKGNLKEIFFELMLKDKDIDISKAFLKWEFIQFAKILDRYKISLNEGKLSILEKNKIGGVR